MRRVTTTTTRSIPLGNSLFHTCVRRFSRHSGGKDLYSSWSRILEEEENQRKKELERRTARKRKEREREKEIEQRKKEKERKQREKKIESRIRINERNARTNTCSLLSLT